MCETLPPNDPLTLIATYLTSQTEVDLGNQVLSNSYNDIAATKDLSLLSHSMNTTLIPLLYAQ